MKSIQSRAGAALRTAARTLAAIVAVTLFGGFASPAHALNPIMHNSSSTTSSYWGGGWGNTAASKYGKFVCTTCHTAGLAAGNAKQIKSTITIPGGPSASGTVVFGSYTAYGKDTAHATSTRVCEVCHSQTTHHRYNNPSANHMGNVDCFTCHSHSNGFKKPACDSCHGNPPTTASLGGTTGMVSPATNGTTGLSPGAHAVHNARGFACTVCHNGNTMPTLSNTIQMGFYGFNGRVTTGTFTGYTTLNNQTFVSSSAGTTVLRRNAATNPTCSNLNCHGGGGSGATSALTGGTNIAPLWTGGSSQAACGTCHGRTAANPPTLGSHTKHAGSTGYSYACSKCHATVTSNAHVRGNVFWRLSTGSTLIPGGSTYLGFTNGSTNAVATKNAYGNCAGLYCHSNGITAGTPVIVPTWGSTAQANWGDCSACHGGSAGSTSAIASNKHGQHISPSVNTSLGLGNGLGCVQCHAKTVSNDTTISTQANHVNGFKDYSGIKARGGANYNTGTKLCSSLYCHSNGNAGGSLVYKNPTAWNAGSSQSCSTCHGSESSPAFPTTLGAPNYASGGAAPNATANSHKKHVYDSGMASTTGCANCHAKTADAATGNKFKDYSAAVYHLNGSATIVFRAQDGKTGTWSGTAASQCTATYCHGTGTTDNWGTVGPLACNKCHSANAATTGSGIQRNWAGAGAQSAHKIHIDSTTWVPTNYLNYSGNVSSATNYRFACSVCHSAAAGATHANGPVQNGRRAAQVFYGYTTNGIAFGSYSAGATAVNNDNGFNWTAGAKCTTTYCHGNGNGGNGLAAVFWNATTGTKNGGNCIKCHGGNVASGTPIATGKHANHINPAVNVSLGIGNGIGCVQCHAKTLSADTTLSNKAKHVNRFKDYSGVRAGGSARYNTTYAKSCNNIYCHSNGNPGAIVFVAMTTSKTWIGAATLGCNGCHGRSNPTTGAPDYANAGGAYLNSHAKHVTLLGITDTTGCAKCHVKTANAGTANKFKDYSAATYHLNGQLNVAIQAPFYGGGSNGSNNYNGGTYTCSNVACHSNQGGTFQSPVWGQTSTGCAFCHPMNTLTGAHRFHVYTSATNTPTVYLNYTANRSNGAVAPGRYNFGCANCHPLTNASHANGTGAVLLDLKPQAANVVGTLKNKNSASISQGAVLAGVVNSGTFGTPGTSVKCFGVYCHSNGGSAAGAAAFQAYTSPEWYTSAGKPSDPCAMCHGNSPNSARAGDSKLMAGSAAHYNTNWLGTGQTGGHAIGIHTQKIAKGANFIGLLQPGTTEPSSHGATGTVTPTTINCNTCHNLTVTSSANDKNVICTTCHGSSAPLKGNAAIAFKNKHVNGAVDVSFQSTTVYSRAQIRDAAFALNSSSTLWHRNGTFKTSGSYDSSKQNLNTSPAYVTGGNCTVICHFKQPLKWSNTPGTIDCYSCHKNM